MMLVCIHNSFHIHKCIETQIALSNFQENTNRYSQLYVWIFKIQKVLMKLIVVQCVYENLFYQYRWAGPAGFELRRPPPWSSENLVNTNI